MSNEASTDITPGVVVQVLGGRVICKLVNFIRVPVPSEAIMGQIEWGGEH